jgi:hypothetical protein
MNASMERSNYKIPPLFQRHGERCRSCAEAYKPPGYGNSIGCRLHQVSFVRHSHRCDAWHLSGTLF